MNKDLNWDDFEEAPLHSRPPMLTHRPTGLSISCDSNTILMAENPLYTMARLKAIMALAHEHGLISGRLSDEVLDKYVPGRVRLRGK